MHACKKGISFIDVNKLKYIRFTYDPKTEQIVFLKRRMLPQESDFLEKHVRQKVWRSREYEMITSSFCKRVLYFSTLDRPANWGSPVLDLNFAYKICLETMNNVLIPKERTGNWRVYYNLEKVKQFIVNALEKHHKARIWDPYVVSSNIESENNSQIYNLEGYVEAFFHKGFFRPNIYEKRFNFQIKINPEKNKIINFKYFENCPCRRTHGLD